MISLLLGLLGCGPREVPPAPPVEDALSLPAACAGTALPAPIRIQRSLGRSVHGEVLLVSVENAEALLVVPAHPLPDPPCPLLPLEASTEAATALLPPSCDKASCPAVVLLRDRDGHPLSAAIGAPVCDASATIETRRWFPDQDSLVLSCRRSSGTSEKERLVLLHPLGDNLSVLLEVETGVFEHLSEEEQAEGACPARPVGGIALIEAGAQPRLEVIDPSRGELVHDGAGTALKAHYRFDPAAGRFVQEGPGEQVPVDARAACRSKP